MMAKDILSNLTPAKGSRRKPKRIGRGQGSGHGGTATRGHKGQGSRSGSTYRAWFEGGQMPLQRRLPKRGFTNIFRKEYAVVNLDQITAADFKTEVTCEALKDKGIVSKSYDGVKILGRGEIKKALTFKVAKCSESARQKIEAVGGRVEVTPCRL